MKFDNEDNIQNVHVYTFLYFFERSVLTDLGTFMKYYYELSPKDYDSKGINAGIEALLPKWKRRKDFYTFTWTFSKMMDPVTLDSHADLRINFPELDRTHQISFSKKG